MCGFLQFRIFHDKNLVTSRYGGFVLIRISSWKQSFVQRNQTRTTLVGVVIGQKSTRFHRGMLTEVFHPSFTRIVSDREEFDTEFRPTSTQKRWKFIRPIWWQEGTQTLQNNLKTSIEMETPLKVEILRHKNQYLRFWHSSLDTLD